nr:hypothetical protein [Tanacetum cinerariifolium]
NDLVAGLPKFKYHKEHLCPSCEQGKSNINGKRYVLVVVDDYSRYMWVHFFRSKDEAPEVIIKFLKRITNGVVERRNWTLVEAARTMLIFSRAPLFCFMLSHREDIGKLSAKGDIGFFIKVYNHQTKKIMETMNVSFDELSTMPFKQRSSKLGLNSTARTVSPAQEPQVCQSSTASTTIADNVPIPTNSSSHATNIPIASQDVDKLNLNAMSMAIRLSIHLQIHPQVLLLHLHHNKMWIHRTCIRFINHTLTNSNGLRITLWNNTMELKNVKEAMTDPAWIDSMQEELL